MLREMNHRVKNLFAIIGEHDLGGARTHREIGSLRHRHARPHLGARAGAFAGRSSDGQGMSDLAGLIGATLLPVPRPRPHGDRGPPRGDQLAARVVARQ
ncbi:hypothetical protein ACU4GR_06180 [Methylobacterium oryzae CBMB20]